MAAVQSLAYQMNFAARNLRSERTGMIVLALPELSLSYFAVLADSVIDAARRRAQPSSSSVRMPRGNVSWTSCAVRSFGWWMG